MIENENVVETEQTNEYQEYIDTIADLKANSVSKDKYDQLMAEKKQLIEALKSGQQITEVVEEKPVNIDELRNELYGKPEQSMSNLEYVTKTLQLRNAIMEAGGDDPFMPNGSGYTYDKADAEKAAYVAQVFQECIDYADGDDQLFTQELMRRTKDDPIRPGRKK